MAIEPTEDLPLLTFVTTHTVMHDGVTYPPGSEFTTADPKVIAHLRGAHAIALREEIDKPEDVAIRVARLENENKRLRAELATLRAELERVGRLDSDATKDAAREAAQPETQNAAAAAVVAPAPTPTPARTSPIPAKPTAPAAKAK